MHNRRQFIHNGSLGGIGLLIEACSSRNCSIPTLTKKTYNEIVGYTPDVQVKEMEAARDTLVTNDRNLTSLLETYIPQLRGTSTTDSAFSALAFTYMALEEECKYGQSRTISGVPIISNEVRDRIIDYSKNDVLVDKLKEARSHLIKRDPLLKDLLQLYVGRVGSDSQNAAISAVSFLYMALLKAKSEDVKTPTKSPISNEIATMA